LHGCGLSLSTHKSGIFIKVVLIYTSEPRPWSSTYTDNYPILPVAQVVSICHIKDCHPRNRRRLSSFNEQPSDAVLHLTLADCPARRALCVLSYHLPNSYFLSRSTCFDRFSPHRRLPWKDWNSAALAPHVLAALGVVASFAYPRKGPCLLVRVL
jgi:hypothetical protein